MKGFRKIELFVGRFSRVGEISLVTVLAYAL